MAFYSCSRWGSKSVLANLGKFPSVLGVSQYAQSAAIPKINIKKFEPPKQEHYEDKNTRLNRPLSPHLTIYAFPLPAMLSISHRASGMMLTGYVTAMGLGALMMPHDISHYITMAEGLSPAVLFLAKAFLAAPFSYHFVNGVRHLYWDTAKGLTMKEVYTTGYAMLGVSAIITLILAAL